MPQNTLILPIQGAESGVTRLNVAGSLSAYPLRSDVDQFVIAAPFSIPLDMDVSRPADLYQAAYFLVANGTPALSCVLETNVGWGSSGAVYVSPQTFLTTFPIPNPQGIFTTLLWTYQSPTGPLFPGGTFTPTDQVSVLVRRRATNPADNYPVTLNLFGHLLFRYYKRCQCLC